MLTNPDTLKKEKNTDVYADVLRIDNLPIKFQSDDASGIVGQNINYSLLWNDDVNHKKENVDDKNADDQYENANAKRKTEKLIIKDPDVKSSEDDDQLYIWNVKSLKVALRTKLIGITNQIIQFVFNNTAPGSESGNPPAKKRKTTVLKIPSNDLGGLKMRRSDGSAVIVDWETYKTALAKGKVDEDDIALPAVEFTDKFAVLFQMDKGVVAQSIDHVLQNTELEALFSAGDSGATDADGKSALIRTDPFQFIVNVGTNIIAVEFEPEKK